MIVDCAEQNINSASLEAGTYILIDPCYFFDDDIDSKLWSNICDLLWDHNDHSRTPMNMAVCDKHDDIHDVYIDSTAYGDGGYPVLDADNVELGNCSVDAGLLSIIPKALFDLYDGESKIRESLYTVITLETPTVVKFVNNDMIFSNGYRLLTSDLLSELSDDDDYDDADEEEILD